MSLVAQFIGSPKMNVFACSTSSGSYTVPGGRGGNYTLGGAATQMGIRPEHISVGASGTGQCDGMVDVIEYLGADTFVLLDCGAAGQINVRISGDADLKVGDVVGLSFDAERTHFFDADGNTINT